MRASVLTAVIFAAALGGCGATPEDLDAASDPAGDASGDAAEVSADAVDATDAADAADATDAADAVARDAWDVALRDASDAAPRDAMDVTLRDASDATTRDGGDATARDGGACPEGMVLVAGRVCVDRWEAALEVTGMDGGVSPWSPYENPGTQRVRAVTREAQVPQGYITGEQAERACAAAGKRLCALDEWLAACRGPANLVYPYGNSYVRRRCNEGRTPHPVVQFFGTSMGVFTFANMNNPGINMQPDTVARTGAFAECVSPWGIHDMVGNLHEWIADPAGTFKGGFYVDAEINGRGCLYTTTAHAFSYRDYSTGFRCCAAPR